MEVKQTKVTKHKKGQIGNSGITFTAAMGILIAVIVGVVLYTVVEGVVHDQTTLGNQQENFLQYNGSTNIILANVPVFDISSFVQNSTGAALVEGENYTFDKVRGVISNGTGNVNLGVDASGSLNNLTYNITYTSEPAGFIEPGTQQTIVVILPILFLVFLIMFMLGVKLRGGNE